jgi:hypothetical protein
MMQYLLIFVGLALGNTLFAQNLSVSNIPAELRKDANLVKRHELLEITIKSPGKAIIKHKYAYTILNDYADDYADFSAYYSKFVTIEDIEGRLLDASGKELKKVKKKDISDVSSESGMTVTDARLKLHSFNHRIYPYTVEYTAVLELNGMFSLPGWVPQNSPFMAVEQSTLVVKTPAGFDFRHKAYNYDKEPTVATNGDGKVYEWKAEQMKTQRPESMMPGWSRERAYVALAPNQFEIEGYKGTMNNWNEFGSFIYELIKNRDALPPAMATKVKQMVAGENDPYKKIQTLYKYLQDNTRYISIQLGIGGWQPIPAEKVAQNGYGDCKALTNYMAAMLREVGIPSKYALIHSGEAGLYTDPNFVSNQFDHVILCVPMIKDTVWLECTSSILPAGYLGDFTYNRPSLLIDEKGGNLVFTPSYTKYENVQNRKIIAAVDEKGTLQAKAITLYSGLQQDALHGMVKTSPPDRILKVLRNRFDLPTYDIADYHYDEKAARIPTLTETINLTSNGFAQVSGKRIFILPNILSKSGMRLSKDSVRKFDIEIDFDYIDYDTVYIALPAGYEVETLPKPVQIKSDFGEYAATWTYESDQLIFTRSMQQNKGRYPPDNYGDLVQFFQTIYKADRNNVVMKKKE